MKVVLDTNILVSGIARPHGTPGRIVTAWLEGQFDLVVSNPLLDEFERVLQYPKVWKLLSKAGITAADLRDYLDILRIKAIPVSAENVSLPLVPADPKDVHLLEALAVSGAEFLVTGDKKHLLSLGMPQIVTASDFAARIEALKSLTRKVTAAQQVASKVLKKRAVTRRRGER